MSIVWLPIAGGFLALGPKPKKRALPELGATGVLTLLSEREGARDIGDAAAHAGLGWTWLPLANGRPPAHARDEEIRAALAGARDAIRAGGRVYVHCSAGIHRTGMMGYALLRLLALAPGDARAALLAMREVTAGGVGEERIAWGERFIERSGA